MDGTSVIERQLTASTDAAPRPLDPLLLRAVGAVAALDGSFSEGDGLSYAWTVSPEGATLLDAESPFATLIVAGLGPPRSGRRRSAIDERGA